MKNVIDFLTQLNKVNKYITNLKKIPDIKKIKPVKTTKDLKQGLCNPIKIFQFI